MSDLAIGTTEQGNKLPAWQVVKLGEILTKSNEWITIKPDEQYRQITVRLWGKGVVQRAEVSGAEIASEKQFVVRQDQFILSRIDARNGAFGLVPDWLDGAVVSNDFPAFALDSSRIIPAFLGWLSRTEGFINLCKAASKGTTNRVRLQEDRFLAMEISLPPLDEQRRIVAHIDALAARIEEARGLRRGAVEEAGELLAAEIVALFKRGQEEGWRKGTLGDYILDSSYGTSEKTSDDTSGTPILRMGNIQNGRLDLHDLKYLFLSEREYEKLLLLPGDILVNRTNSAELVGKCAVFDVEGEYSYASYLIRLRLNKTQADPKLVAYFINSPLGRAYMFNERKQMTGQANINTTHLKELPISLPSLPEQHRIVAYLDELQAKADALKQAQAEAAAELEALLPAVLDQAFRGEL